jgi:hypothetical protein
MNPTFSLRTRQEKGDTPRLQEWGSTANMEYSGMCYLGLA